MMFRALSWMKVTQHEEIAIVFVTFREHIEENGSGSLWGKEFPTLVVILFPCRLTEQRSGY